MKIATKYILKSDDSKIRCYHIFKFKHVCMYIYLFNKLKPLISTLIDAIEFASHKDLK